MQSDMRISHLLIKTLDVVFVGDYLDIGNGERTFETQTFHVTLIGVRMWVTCVMVKHIACSVLWQTAWATTWNHGGWVEVWERAAARAARDTRIMAPEEQQHTRILRRGKRATELVKN